ncbi:MAG: hypothetical protein GEU86_10005 [Actinophytocola sp.]|nr:hypothetical protein [Actinophytocola sp.]
MHAAKPVFAVVIVLAWALLATPAAYATVLDPLPDRIEPNQTYTVGYWVMQHAAHPYEGDLADTGLKIVAEDGTTHTFEGVPLGQPSHYAATLAVPQRGTWQLYAMQGLFDEYLIGTLTVPGGLAARPLPPPVVGHADQHQWGLISSPDLADQADRQAGGSPGETGHRHDVAPSGQTADEEAGTVSAEAVWALIAVAAAGTLLLARVAGSRIRAHRRAVDRSK